jgi:hypothetical protein
LTCEYIAVCRALIHEYIRQCLVTTERVAQGESTKNLSQSKNALFLCAPHEPRGFDAVPCRRGPPTAMCSAMAHGAVNAGNVLVRWPASTTCPPPAWRRVHAVLCDWAGTTKKLSDGDLDGTSNKRLIDQNNLMQCPPSYDASVDVKGRMFAAPLCVLALAPAACFRLFNEHKNRAEVEGMIMDTDDANSSSVSYLRICFRQLGDMKDVGVYDLSTQRRTEPRICVTRHGTLIESDEDDDEHRFKKESREQPEVHVNFIDSYTKHSQICTVDAYKFSVDECGHMPTTSALIINECDGWLLVEIYASTPMSDDIVTKNQPKEGLLSHPTQTVECSSVSAKSSDDNNTADTHAIWQDLANWALIVRDIYALKCFDGCDRSDLMELEKVLQMNLLQSPV